MRVKLTPDSMIYITCENSAVIAVIGIYHQQDGQAIGEHGSTGNAHRLVISPDGQRLYTESKEDALRCR